jgi:hypothetical protein
MRHALIHRTAEVVDLFVDTYKKKRNRRTFPHKEVSNIIQYLFPGSSWRGRGAFKSVHRVYSRGRTLALKTSNPKNIRGDLRVYRRIPATIRNRYFAKVYWHTKYCLLQKYGRQTGVPQSVLVKLKGIGRQYGLRDIRSANVRKVEGRFKIVDASPA